MSFLKSFFGAMAAAEISEKKRVAREKENARKQQLNDEIKVLQLEREFLEYMSSINCKNVSDFDEAISAKHSPGDIWQTKHVISNYKEKLKEFMRLGGEPVYITEFEKMDLYIEIVRRLKEYGWLDKQDQYVKYADDTYYLDFDWKYAQKDNHKLNVQIPLLFNAQGNELTKVLSKTDYGFIPYEGHHNAIVIDVAKSNDETLDNFLDFLTISIVFSDQYIIIYSYEHDSMYYKADITQKKVYISTAPVSGDWSLVEINGMDLLFNTKEAEKVAELYERHNANVIENIQQQYTAAYEDINSLTGVEFENVCKLLLENMGFSVETTKTTGDGGIDLIAYNFQPLLSGKYIVQCKRYTGSVGEPVIRDLYGVVTAERANKGILMTTGHFTKSATAFATGKPIELIDGIALRNLISQYGLNVVSTKIPTVTHTTKESVAIQQSHTTPEDAQLNCCPAPVLNSNFSEVIQENWQLEDVYNEFLCLKSKADNTNNEVEVADYINWLINKNDYENFIVCECAERMAFFTEINTYIKKYLQIRQSSKSKLLSYLYQMIYVQNCILLECFTDAKIMFIDMMKNSDIQFNLFETMRETNNTADIFKNTGVFSFLFATWCNMHQVAYITQDDALRDYLTDHNLFYGVPIMQDGRIQDNLELIESGRSSLNPLFFQKQHQLIEELNGYDNVIEMKIFFRIDNSEVIESFYDYSYQDGETIDNWPAFFDYTIENGSMVIDTYSVIQIDKALSNYVPFSQNDLT